MKKVQFGSMTTIKGAYTQCLHALLATASSVALVFGGIAFGATAAGASPSVGTISMIAGNGTAGYSGDGSSATSATLRLPQGAAIDPTGDLAIADTANNVIRFVPASSGTFFGHAMAAGDIYTIAGNGSPGYVGNGVPGTSAELQLPGGVAFDSSGDVVVADHDTNTVRVVANSSGGRLGLSLVAGDIYTLAGSPAGGYSGDDGPASAAQLHGPESVAVDSGGIAIADEYNNVIRYIATSSGTYFGILMTAGDIYTIAGDSVAGYNGDGRPALSAELSNPVGVALDPFGGLAIADNANNRVRYIPASSGTYFGASMVADDLYTVAGTGTPGYSGDGGPASASLIDAPMGVAFDGLGDLGIADTFNHVVRFVAAASGNYFGGFMHVGDIYTIAGNGTFGSSGNGNVATGAELTYPFELAFSNNDSLVIADQQSENVREVESGWSSPAITSAAAAYATVGHPFSFTATASGSPTPYVTLSGALPGGLSFSASSNGSGVISGTPTSAGTFTVFVNASNGVSPAPSSALTLNVSRTAPCVGSRLNPKQLTEHRSTDVTINGCVATTAATAKVSARLVNPDHVTRTSTLRISASGKFRYATGKLVAGTSVVTFRLGHRVLFVTSIHTS